MNVRSTSNFAEAELIAQLQNRKTRDKAFKNLVLLYQERLYWHILKIVGEHEDANDVIQNTFIKVYQNLENFQGNSKLYTWLYRIATNEAITFLTKKKKKATEGLDQLDKTTVTDAYLEEEEIELKFNKAISQLPDKQKIVFNLRYFNEMSYQDMAVLLDTSVGALKASYHHAVKKIENSLKEN